MINLVFFSGQIRKNLIIFKQNKKKVFQNLPKYPENPKLINVLINFQIKPRKSYKSPKNHDIHKFSHKAIHALNKLNKNELKKMIFHNYSPHKYTFNIIKNHKIQKA